VVIQLKKLGIDDLARPAPYPNPDWFSKPVIWRFRSHFRQ